MPYDPRWFPIPWKWPLDPSLVKSAPLLLVALLGVVLLGGCRTSRVVDPAPHALWSSCSDRTAVTHPQQVSRSAATPPADPFQRTCDWRSPPSAVQTGMTARHAARAPLPGELGHRRPCRTPVQVRPLQRPYSAPRVACVQAPSSQTLQRTRGRPAVHPVARPVVRAPRVVENGGSPREFVFETAPAACAPRPLSLQVLFPSTSPCPAPLPWKCEGDG